MQKILKIIKNSTIFNYWGKYLILCVFKFLSFTYRIEIKYCDGIKIPLEQNFGIFYFWHQNIIACTSFFYKNRCFGHCVVSPSKDGKFIGFIAQKLGFEVLYGSSSKKTIELVKSSLDVLRKEKKICLVGDGSRGPAFKMQKGLIYLAEKSDLPLIFVECKSFSAITFKKSWDNFQFPLPFSKILITINSPVKVFDGSYKSF